MQSGFCYTTYMVFKSIKRLKSEKNSVAKHSQNVKTWGSYGYYANGPLQLSLKPVFYFYLAILKEFSNGVMRRLRERPSFLMF